MSDSGPEILDRQVLRALLQHPDQYMEENYGEQMDRYEQAGRLGRWIIGKRSPRVKEHLDCLRALESGVEAQKSAYANEGNIEIL